MHAHDPIPRRALGKTGVQVSAMGLGGSHLGSMPDADEAIRVVHAAIDAGVNFLRQRLGKYYDAAREPAQVCSGAPSQASATRSF